MSGISLLVYLILTLSVGYIFAYPNFNDIAILNKEKQKYNDSLRVVADIENKKKELLVQFNKISDLDRRNIETVIPDSSNFVRLIFQIDSVGSSLGISIDRISSREKSDSGDKSVNNANNQKSYHSLFVSFSFITSYEKFMIFMDTLEKSLRVLDIRSLKVAPSGVGSYSFTVEIETYWAKKI